MVAAAGVLSPSHPSYSSHESESRQITARRPRTMTFISPRASGRPSPSSSSTIDRPAGRSPSVCPAAVTVRSVDQSKGEAEHVGSVATTSHAIQHTRDQTCMSNRVATPLHVHKCMANSSSASLSLSLSLSPPSSSHRFLQHFFSCYFWAACVMHGSHESIS